MWWHSFYDNLVLPCLLSPLDVCVLFEVVLLSCVVLYFFIEIMLAYVLSFVSWLFVVGPKCYLLEWGWTLGFYMIGWNVLCTLLGSMTLFMFMVIAPRFEDFFTCTNSCGLSFHVLVLYHNFIISCIYFWCTLLSHSRRYWCNDVLL